MNITINSKNTVRRFSWTKTSLLALMVVATWIVVMTTLYGISPRLHSTDPVPGAGASEKYFPGKENDDLGIGLVASEKRFPGKEKDDLDVGMAADRSYDNVEAIRSARSTTQVADHSYDAIESIRSKRDSL